MGKPEIVVECDMLGCRHNKNSCNSDIPSITNPYCIRPTIRIGKLMQCLCYSKRGT